MTDDTDQFDDDHAIEKLKGRIDAVKDWRESVIEQEDEYMVEFCTGRISGLCSAMDDMGQFDGYDCAIEKLKSQIDTVKDWRESAIEQEDDYMVEFCTGRISGLCSAIYVLRDQQVSTDTDELNRGEN
jgi:hypothetical protein